MPDITVAIHSIVQTYLESVVAHFRQKGMVASIDKGLSISVKSKAIKFKVWVQFSRSGRVFKEGDVFVHRISFALFRDWPPVLSSLELDPELSNICEIVSACPFIGGEDTARCVESLYAYDLDKLTHYLSNKATELTRVFSMD